MMLEVREIDEVKRAALVGAPYTMLDRIRMVPGGRWDKERKVWHFPLASLPALVHEFNGDGELRSLGGFASVLLDRSRHLLELRKRTDEIARTEASAIESGTRAWGSELKPFAHQRRDVARALRSCRFALFHETGTGKTISGGMWLSALIRDEVDMRLGVVVCPVTLIESAWIPDLQRWFPDLYPINARRLKKGSREYETRRLADLHKRAVLVVNYEMVKGDSEIRRLMSGAPVVFDESSRMKSVAAKTTHTMHEISPTLRGCLLLSGTPAPNTPLEYWPQIKVIEYAGGHRVLPRTHREFTEEFSIEIALPGKDGQCIRKVPPGKLEKLQKQVAPCASWVRKVDCTDLPEKMFIETPIEMRPDGAAVYADMRDKMAAVIRGTLGAKPSAVNAVNALSQMMKLRQITAGFAPVSAEDWLAGGGAVNMVPVDSEKLDWIVEHCADAADRVVVWTQFQYESDRIMEALAKRRISAVQVDGRVKDQHRAEAFSAFKSDAVQVAVLHPGVAKYGISFPGVTAAIYSSCSYSLEEYRQSQDRIHGIGRGSTTARSTFYVLTARADGEPTIDQRIQAALEGKGRLLDIVFELGSQGRVTA